MLGRVRQPRHCLGIGRLALILAGGWLGALSLTAAAQDKPPYLLREPTEYMDVIDAFDESDDPIDFNVRLGFVRSQEDAAISRERNPAGAFGVDRVHIGDYHSVRSQLVLGADVGLYKDLMLFGELPLVFSDTRELTLPDAARCDSSQCKQRARVVDDVLREPVPNGDARPLFQLPPTTAARTRSGVPSVDVGLAWGVMNQYREPGLPTWVLVLESRFSLGSPMAACLDTGSCDPGKSRGTTRLRIGSRWSYRYRDVEPYLGIDYAFEWASSASAAFEPGGSDQQLAETGLPGIAGLTVGGTLVPWEHRGRFQQFIIDLRGRAEYVTAGRDYTPLFDVLGRSDSPFLTTPLSRAGGKSVPFNGLTHADAHARLAFNLGLAMQAARYVRFRLDLLVSHASEHLLTGAPACTESARSGTGAVDQCGNKQPNALYRAVIDAPGQRFLQSAALAYTLSATATAQF